MATGYSTELLITRLSTVDWNIKSDLVQDYWNELENKLITVVDDLVPLTTSRAKKQRQKNPQNLS